MPRKQSLKEQLRAERIEEAQRLLGAHGTKAAAAAAMGLSERQYRRLLEGRTRDDEPGLAATVAAAAAQDASGTMPTDLSAVLQALVAQQALQQQVLDQLLTKGANVNAPVPAPSAKAPLEPEKPVAGGTTEPPETRRTRRPGRRFVLTAAQNNTYVHPGFMAALRVFCDHNGAELLIARYAYNKSAYDNEAAGGLTTKDDEALWYDPEILPFVCDEPVQLARDLVFCGELDILPTAVDPLSGLESYTKSASAIVPHAKVALKSMPVMKCEAPRFLYTTGTVTQRNYIQRKAGQKAEFHHTFAALYVEIDGAGDWFARQLVADDGGAFQDLETVYSAGGVHQSHVEAINWGDIHIEKEDPEISEACWHSKRSIIEALRPRYQFVHDLSDFTARNHHNIKDPHFLAEQYFGGIDTVEEGLSRAAAFLAKIERPWCRTVVVESNHDQAFKRWLSEADCRHDPQNARYFHYWSYRIYDAIERRDRGFSVFESAIREKADLPGTTFLREDEAFVICEDHGGGIECSMHGHRGPNGARGNPKSYRTLGRRCNTGHTHSAGIFEGIYTAGVSGLLDMGYNVGPSSWSHSHIVTYPNGKRAVITMRGRKWRSGSVVQAALVA